jgi:hypothetical protein
MQVSQIATYLFVHTNYPTIFQHFYQHADILCIQAHFYILRYLVWQWVEFLTYLHQYLF